MELWNREVLDKLLNGLGRFMSLVEDFLEIFDEIIINEFINANINGYFEVEI